MEIWLVIVLCIACIIFGFLCGVWHQKQSEKCSGSLFVDSSGIYTVWDVDPKMLPDGQRVYMDVNVVKLKKPETSQ